MRRSCPRRWRRSRAQRADRRQLRAVSWRRGTKRGASPTVTSPFPGGGRRAAGDPLTNWSGVSRALPLPDRGCLGGGTMLNNEVVVHGDVVGRSPRAVQGVSMAQRCDICGKGPSVGIRQPRQRTPSGGGSRTWSRSGLMSGRARRSVVHELLESGKVRRSFDRHGQSSQRHLTVRTVKVNARLAAQREGAQAPPDWLTRREAAPPLRRSLRTVLTFLLLGAFFSPWRNHPSLWWSDDTGESPPCLLLLFLGALLLRHANSPPFPWASSPSLRDAGAPRARARAAHTGGDRRRAAADRPPSGRPFRASRERRLDRMA